MKKARRHVTIGYEDSDGADQEAKKDESSGEGGHDVKVFSLEQVAVLPEPGDNVAIARMPIAKGTKIQLGEDDIVSTSHALLEGHRFAIKPVKLGDQLLSWGLMFGICIKDISPGQTVANWRMLESLAGRGVADLPEHPNFDDKIVRYDLPKTAFSPAQQVVLKAPEQRGHFEGFHRPGPIGTGTRNCIIIIGTTSHTAGYVKRLADKYSWVQAEKARDSRGSGKSKIGQPKLSNVDCVVCIDHTEAGGSSQPSNFQLLLNTLSGFVCHSNVGAALVVDYGNEVLTGKILKEHMEKHPGRYPLRHVRHHFLSLSGEFEQDLKQGRQIIDEWLPLVNQCRRSARPLSELKVALQCGGSDAFSGVSGNPCAGTAAKLLIEQGGQALLAETPELVGAESYILKRVKDYSVARKFLTFVERFKQKMAWHGQSAEANPSGGNQYRGL